MSTLSELTAQTAAELQAAWMTEHADELATITAEKLTAVLKETGSQAKTIAAEKYTTLRAEKLNTISRRMGEPQRWCRKCGGTGYTAYKHIRNGECFDCDGNGHVPVNN